MPGGYRDVKVNPVVNEHLCEIQLQLRNFFTLKTGQHAVYTWARELNVTTRMSARTLFENLSPEVTEEMVHLAGENWHGTGFCLADLQNAAGQYDLAEEGLRQVIRFDTSGFARILPLLIFSVGGTSPSIPIRMYLQLCECGTRMKPPIRTICAP